MRYGDTISASATPLSGSTLFVEASQTFVPWQPSTWPDVPNAFDEDFLRVVEAIFRETIVSEIDNVICDALAREDGSLEHRGHVVAIAQLCAIDTLASYAYFDDKRVGGRYQSFISRYFPDDYRSYAKEIYDLYRNAMVHSWNLFEVRILPSDEELKSVNGTLEFGLLNFQKSLKISLNSFLEELRTDPSLQKSIMERYKELKGSARP